MILGIDAHNLRAGGGITHLINLLVQKDFYHGFEKIYLFGGQYILGQLKTLQTKEMINVEVIHYPMLDKPLLIRIFWQQILLPKLLKKLNIDVLFSPGGILPLTVAKNIKTVTMCHNMLPINLKETLHLGIDLRFIRFIILRLVQKMSYAKADGIIFISRHAEEKVKTLVPQITNLTTIIHHGINPRFYNASKNITKTDKIEICYVSTIDVYKHQWEVVKALAILRKRGYHHLHLNLIGSGYPPAVKKLKKTIQQYNMNDHITWKGVMSYLDLPNEYKKSSLFVFASSCENCPNILLEAMASKLPIACSHNDPMPEFADNDTVQFFEPKNPESIADALAFLIDNPDLAAKKAKQAYQLSKTYRWDICAVQTLELFHKTYTQRSHINSTWLIGPLPPPLLGQSLAFKMLCDNVQNNHQFQVINIGGENLERRDGSFSTARINTLIAPFLKALILPIIKEKNIYLTIAQSWVGFLRDFIFIFFSYLGRHRIILHLHGGNYDNFFYNQSPLKQKLIKWTLSKAEKIIVLSYNLKQMFSFLPDFAQKVIVVANGLPFDEHKLHTSAKQLPSSPDTPIILLYLSNLIETKGYLYVLKTAYILKNQYNIPVKLYLCGKFSLASDSRYKTTQDAQDDFFKRVTKLDLKDNVIWTGAIDGQEKEKQLREAHFFILPTNYNNEGQPLSIIEAMAYGCCVLTTKYRAIPDLIGNEEGGIYIPFNDAEAIASKIQSFYNNKPQFANISTNAIKRYYKYFTKSVHLTNLKDAILN